MYDVLIINTNDVNKFYHNEADGIKFNDISNEELKILCDLIKRHNYTIIMNVKEKI